MVTVKSWIIKWQGYTKEHLGNHNYLKLLRSLDWKYAYAYRSIRIPYSFKSYLFYILTNLPNDAILHFIIWQLSFCFFLKKLISSQNSKWESKYKTFLGLENGAKIFFYQMSNVLTVTDGVQV